MRSQKGIQPEEAALFAKAFAPMRGNCQRTSNYSLWLVAYKPRLAKININMAQPTYYDLVYAVTREIPEGRVTTYGAIADFLALGSARMVGWALNKSFSQDAVPAQRVVNRKGELSGRNHFPTPTMMQELLEEEGVEVKDNRVVNFDKRFWHPEALGEAWGIA